MKTKEGVADEFNGGGSPYTKSYETTPERFAPFSQPFTSLDSPSSDPSSLSFNTNKEDANMDHSKRNDRDGGGNFASRIRDHVKMGPKFSETVKGKLSLGARIIQQGGRENIFKQIFGISEGEEFLKASQCYLSTTHGPIAGLLFISTEKICFCSERSIILSSSTGQPLRIPYKVLIPTRKIRSVYQGENVNKPDQKYIEIVTTDDFEFWFMGFLRYEKAFRNLEKAISMAKPTVN